MQRYKITYSYLMNVGASALGVPQTMRTEGVGEIDAKTSADAVEKLGQQFPAESELTVLGIVRLEPARDATGPLEVGYYSTTDEFRAIAQHAAVMRPDRSLVAVTGPSTGKGAMEALEFARLFAAGPDLLAACETAQLELARLREHIERIGAEIALHNTCLAQDRVSAAIAKAKST